MTAPDATTSAVATVRTAFAHAGLARLWATLDQRYGLDSGAYFLHPLALPVVELPGWAVPKGAPGVSAARASAVAGYLHARLLDDQLDADQSTAPMPLAASFCLTVHLRLLAEAAGPVDMLGEAVDRWGAFCRAMADEQEARQTSPIVDAAAHHRSLDRSRAMVLPALAVRRRAGQDPTPLTEVADALVDAHQRLTDVIDLERDEHHGLRTHAWHALGLQHGPGAPFQDGRLDAWFDHIDRLHQEAEQHAAHLPGLVAWLSARKALAHDVQKRLWTGYLKAWLTTP